MLTAVITLLLEAVANCDPRAIFAVSHFAQQACVSHWMRMRGGACSTAKPMRDQCIRIWCPIGVSVALEGGSLTLRQMPAR